VQLLGKLQGGMLAANLPFLPKVVGQTMARHSIDWIAFSEDLPDPHNQVILDGDMIKLSITPNNTRVHGRLVKRMASLLRATGYPIVVTRSLVGHSIGHQCGTVRFGTDLTTSALDPYCRTHDQRNLYVVDASFMPSSSALNPALTIAAQALRSADHLLATDFGVTNLRKDTTPREHKKNRSPGALSNPSSA
jgi:choline dehydrogenase-like flavoprotein